MNEIFSNLSEGIILVKKNCINFANEVFNEILKSVNIDPDSPGLMDIKMFRLYRSNEHFDEEGDRGGNNEPNA